MRRPIRGLATAAVLALALTGCSPSPRDRALGSIDTADLKRHLDILAADEFRGRDTPSPELKIASRYIAVLAESYGLDPLLPDGSFLQEIPVTVTEADASRTGASFRSVRGDGEYVYLRDFVLQGRGLSPSRVRGRVVFLGLGLSAPDLGWDDIGELDLAGTIVVMLDPDLPEDHRLMTPENRRLLRRRPWTILQKGAAAVLTAISEEREARLREGGGGFSPARDVALGAASRAGAPRDETRRSGGRRFCRRGLGGAGGRRGTARADDDDAQEARRDDRLHAGAAGGQL